MRFKLIEAKQDYEKLVNFAGQELADKFMSLKNKIKSPMNDIYYWLKRDVKEFEDFLSETEETKSNTQKRQEEKEGAKLVFQNENGKVYQIFTYDASKYYGKGTKWCISGNYPGHEGRGEQYFNDYIRSAKLYQNSYFFAFTNDNHKFAILINKFGEVHSVWNERDNAVKRDFDDVKNAPIVTDFIDTFDLDIDMTTFNYKDLKIDKIYLLSIDEAKKLPQDVRKYQDRWWLRSPCYTQDIAACVCNDGSVYYCGDYVHLDIDCVRPALHISNLNSSNSNLYDGVIIKNGEKKVKFIYIGNGTLLYNDKPIKHIFDEESSDYNKSEIKKFVENDFLKEVFGNKIEENYKRRNKMKNRLEEAVMNRNIETPISNNIVATCNVGYKSAIDDHNNNQKRVKDNFKDYELDIDDYETLSTKKPFLGIKGNEPERVRSKNMKAMKLEKLSLDESLFEEAEEKKQRAIRVLPFEDLYDEVYSRLSSSSLLRTPYADMRGIYDDENELGLANTDETAIAITTKVKENKLDYARNIAKEYGLKAEYMGPSYRVGEDNERLIIYVPDDAESPFNAKLKAERSISKKTEYQRKWKEKKAKEKEGNK